MSRLRLIGHSGLDFKLNVTQFRSPMSASITSVQTHTMLQHFPIRCGQPDIQFTCQFTSIDEKRRFTNFVREHQVRVLEDYEANSVTLWWPERNIENWEGYISMLKVSERRFDYAPVVTFGVDLVESMMSEKTTVSSTSASFSAVYGPQIPFWSDFEDAILKIPGVVYDTVRNYYDLNEPAP